MVDMTKLAIGLASAIIGVIVLTGLVGGLYPTLTSTLTTLNNTGYNSSGSVIAGSEVLQLRSIIAPDGVIPLIVIAVFVIVTILGLFTLVKNKR